MPERIRRAIWRIFRYLPPRIAYSIGLGSVVGKSVLLLHTIGRISGRQRVTPLLYDEIGDMIYIASARGKRADWYRNIQTSPNVDLTIGNRHFSGCAEIVSDTGAIADFLEYRLKHHPWLMRAALRLEGLNSEARRRQIERYASTRALVAIRRL